MSDNSHLLIALRDVGIEGPASGDTGDKQIRAALAREITGGRRPYRRLGVPFSTRSIAMLPAALLVTVATAAAAAATVALINASPTALFEHNPQANASSGWNQTVITSTVRKIASVEVPGIGAVQYWIAATEQHGRCWGLRGPSGTWLTLGTDYDRSGGSIPGCGPTREQQVLAQGNSSLGLMPTSVDDLVNAVENRSGQWWDIYFGTVTANGAVAVRDQRAGQTARVIAGQYFILVVRQRGNLEGGDDLRAINASGSVLPADYGPERYRNH